MKARSTDKDTVPVDAEAPESNGEEFLSRWSRRKREAQQAVEKNDKLPEVVDKPVEPVNHLTDADMPPLESLTEDSDYSGFLSPNVSEALRKQALRKLFHSAGINVRDGLDDYDENYTEFTKLGDIVTADIKHRLEKEMQFKDKVVQVEPLETTATITQEETTGQADQTHESDEGVDSEENA